MVSVLRLKQKRRAKDRDVVLEVLLYRCVGSVCILQMWAAVCLLNKHSNWFSGFADVVVGVGVGIVVIGFTSLGSKSLSALICV